MLVENTVLILGAGASEPYGFPLGRKLVFEIVDLLGSGSNKNHIKEHYGKSDEEIALFRKELKGSFLTIDAFLEEHPQFAEIGKAAIAMVLIPLERSDSLIRQLDKKWYEYLCENMGPGREKFLQNAKYLSIVSFNYDRSLEFYLYHTLSNSYSREVALQIITEIPFVHVYGQLGKPNFLTPEPVGRDYAGQITGINAEDIDNCVSNILIMPERQDDSAEFKRAQELITKAERICFLGFGYDETNLRRLKVTEYYMSEEKKKILGSVCMMERDEIRRARDLISRRKTPFGGPITTRLELGETDEDALMFLRRHQVFE